MTNLRSMKLKLQHQTELHSSSDLVHNGFNIRKWYRARLSEANPALVPAPALSANPDPRASYRPYNIHTAIPYHNSNRYAKRWQSHEQLRLCHAKCRDLTPNIIHFIFQGH